MVQHYLSSIYISTFLVLLLAHLARCDLIQDSCINATDYDMNIRYEYCKVGLQSIPGSKNASNVEDLLISLIGQENLLATSMIPIFSNAIKLGKFHGSALQVCLGLYSSAKDYLSDALNDFKSTHGYQKLGEKMSFMSQVPTTCEDAYRAVGVTGSPYLKENLIFYQWALISVAFTNQLKNA